MSGFRKNLWDNLKSRAFRREYVAENVRTGLAYQIKAMRNAREMSQTDLAEATGKSQGNIARWENPDYGSFSLKTLLELANAFDVWLSVEFIPFSKGVSQTENRSTVVLNAIPFTKDWEGRGESVVASANTVVTIGDPRNISGYRAADVFGGYQFLRTTSHGTIEEKHHYLTNDHEVPPITGAQKSVQQLFEHRVY